MFLNLKEIYVPSWEIFLKNWWEYVLVTFIMLVLVFVPFVGGIIQVFIILAINKAVLKVIRNNQIQFSDFFKFKEIVNLKTSFFALVVGLYYFLMQYVVSLSMVMSLAAAVVGIIFFPLFCVAVDKNFTIKETFLYSAKLTKNIRTEIILIAFINFLIGVAGMFLLIVGILVAVPVVFISIIKVYILLENRLNSQTAQI